MRVYPSDVKDWSAELRVSGQKIKPSHPYDLDSADDIPWWLYLFFPFEGIVRLLLKMIF